MGLLDRLTGKGRPGTPRAASSTDLAHLSAWAESRRGVEGFVEPQTSTTATTLVLVAADGEWTRRR
ncbi:MAG: oxidoreductase, partial [Frankiales bacterium]